MSNSTLGISSVASSIGILRNFATILAAAGRSFSIMSLASHQRRMNFSAVAWFFSIQPRFM